MTGRVSRSAPTDRIGAVRDVATRPRTLRLPAVPAPRLQAQRPRRGRELTTAQQVVVDELRLHLLRHPSGLPGSLQRLFHRLDFREVWPIAPGATEAQRRELAAGLGRVMQGVHTEWASWPPAPDRCQDCEIREPYPCARHHWRRWDEVDLLERAAVEITTIVPAAGAAALRGQR